MSCRSFTSALALLGQGMAGYISGLDLEPFSQAVVEEELAALSMTTLATYLADRIIKQLQVSYLTQLLG
jgi:hypothetical protein